MRSITDRDIKVTLPSPSTMQFWFGPLSGAYASSSAFFADLARVYREEIADLAGRGADIVQLDEVALAMLCDPDARDVVAAEGEDPERARRRLRRARSRVRSTACASTVTTGHAPVPRQLQGSLDGERRLRARRREGVRPVSGVDMLFLEFDSERSGDFGPLRHVPEHGDGRARSRQLEDTRCSSRATTCCAASTRPRQVVPVERLALSPQCGFASTVGGNPLTEDDEKRKLARIVEVCEEVWGIRMSSKTGSRDDDRRTTSRSSSSTPTSRRTA